MKIKHHIALILGLFLVSTLTAQEKSAFNAGDITQKTPYGLTKSEKILLKNTEQVDSLDKNIGSMQNRVSTLEEQMEGIRSVLDGTNIRMNKIDKRLDSLESMITGVDVNDTTSYSSRLEKAFANIKENRKIQKINNDKIKKVLTEISTLIDSINENYVPKSSIKNIESRLAILEGNNKPSTLTSPTKKELTTKSTNFEKLTGAQSFKKAKETYANNSLDTSKEHFENAIKKQYKPAESNFYLGEIAYKKKTWNDAIAYYKKSVELYDKAKYLPKLLYHTAISFDKLGDTENANKFYKALKQSYPNSKEAIASPNR